MNGGNASRFQHLWEGSQPGSPECILVPRSRQEVCLNVNEWIESAAHTPDRIALPRQNAWTGNTLEK
jgi:hypothetical protein